MRRRITELGSRGRRNATRIVAVGVVVGALTIGSTVHAAPAGDGLSGVIVVSVGGAVRAVDVPTFPRRVTAPVVDLSLSPSGSGYVTLDALGTITSYGDAPRFSRQRFPRTGAIPVAIALTQTGRGAYVGFIDGTVRALGDAQPVGGPAGGQSRLSPPLVDVALAPNGTGLWTVRSDGSVSALGGAPSLPNVPASGSPVVGIAAAPAGEGAWVARLNGSVVALGDASDGRGPRASTAPRVSDVASLGTQGWIVVDVTGKVEVAGGTPTALPGSSTGFVAIDSLAASAALVSPGQGAPETTKIVSPGAVLGASGEPGGTLVLELPCFVTGGASPLAEGDVIASAIGAHTPDGLLRRVLAIGACADGRVSVTTTPATLAEALPTGAIDFSDELAGLEVPDFTPTSQDGSITSVPASPLAVPSTSASGMAVLEAGAPAVTAGAVGTIAEPGRFQYGCPSDPDDGEPSLKAKPIFSFNPDVVFEGEWDGDEAHIRTGISLQGEIGVEFSANKGISCDATFALIDDYSLGTKVIFVGPIPVVVEPQLTLEAKLEGTVGGALTASASATGTAMGALVVDVGSTSTFNTESSFDADGDLDWALEAKAELSFSLTPSIGFLLYGVVAPTAELETGLAATLEPCASPQLKLEEPVTLTVKLEPSEWFGEMLEPLENLDLEVANEFALPGSPFQLWSGALPVPLPCDEDATTLPEGQVGVPYSTTLDVELPDGATDPAFSVADGSTLPEGLSLGTDGTLSGTPLASGIHTFSVEVTHSLGFTTAAFEITIQEADELEILTTSLPGATLDTPYSSTLQANRPAADLVWTLRSGTLPAGVSLDPDGTLAGTPTATGFFSFTVRVEHPDSGQTAEKVLTLSVRTERIVFTSYRDGNAEIYVMNADGSGQTRLTSNSSADKEPSFSADGTKIAFVSDRDGNWEVYVMDADGSDQTRLTSNSVYEADPSLSADGTKIAFESAREPDPMYGRNRDIYVMNADGSSQVRLTSNPSVDTAPSFSGDGTRIAFYSYRDGSGDIYVMNADGSGQTRLTSTPAGSQPPGLPSFSPDGLRIAFVSVEDGISEIHVINADGSGQTRLTNNSAPDGYPSFSPDGTKLAFVSYRDGNWEVYVMNADGSGQTRLTNNTLLDLEPSFGG